MTVNTLTSCRKGEYFRKEISVANTSVAVWQSVTVAATSETTVTGNVFVPKTQEQFTYDLDGNLTGDGHWTYTWDGENRLTKVESLATGPTASQRRVTWEFDAKGRRVRQTTYNASTGAYLVTEDLKLVSDGWRHIAELNATNNALVRSYVWGLDLSGTMDGAGGVGGLLLINSAANGIHFVAYDGNGNVVALTKTADGTSAANYEYDPFGQPIRVTGVMAKENPFRFSTKRSDRTTEIQLYEQRPLISSISRWGSRDPIEEEGGANVYCFLGNNVVSKIDLYGMMWSIQRNGSPRATATPSTEYDTWDDLAVAVGLDTRDYKRWVQPADPKPLRCKKYSVPNTVFIDLGAKTWLDVGPFNIITLLRQEADWYKQHLSAEGYFVVVTKKPRGSDIMDHLSSKNIQMYYYFGHGWNGGKINTGGYGGTEWVAPARYTIYGISKMRLFACNSMDPVAGEAGRYVHTPWERNVAIRGTVGGFVGEVSGWQWIWYGYALMAVYPGTNN